MKYGHHFRCYDIEEMYLHVERTLIHLYGMKGLLEWGSNSSP